MGEIEELAERFQAQRPQLRSVAYRMLGSLSDADDAVQDAWLRASAADSSEVENLGGWFTTIVARVCLNLLRSRATRREQALGTHVPDPVLSRADASGASAAADPERQALIADSVGLAMLVVLDTLTPDERLAFVLHDSFAVPFDDIAAIVPCSPAAARQLASRARRRVAQAPAPDRDPARQRRAVDAFFAASRGGDFDALVAVLHPDVVLRADGGAGRPSLTKLLRGAATVAGQAVTYAQLAPWVHPVLVNGAAGVVVAPHGEAGSVMAFTVVDGLIAAIDVLADPVRLRELDVVGMLGHSGGASSSADMR
ncbi:RNA polymerase sigma factor SigJ [Agromyces sp. NPDC058484]|uniref:RNA polymerase sigma factor SigJ n=1 Tax=Agromyces sp. NPDC058484 TaxID=3346524 RepID=UPI003665B2B1